MICGRSSGCSRRRDRRSLKDPLGPIPGRPLRSIVQVYWNSRGFCATDARLYRKKKKYLARRAMNSDITSVQEGHVRLADFPDLKRFARKHGRVIFLMEGRPALGGGARPD